MTIEQLIAANPAAADAIRAAYEIGLHTPKPRAKKAAAKKAPAKAAPAVKTELVEAAAAEINAAETAKEALAIISEIAKDRQFRKQELVALIIAAHAPTYPPRMSQKKDELIDRLATPFEDIVSSNHYTAMFAKGF